MKNELPIMKIYPSLNKKLTLSWILDQENVFEVKEVDKTVGGKARLMLFDKNKKLIGFTRMYEIKYLRKKVSQWLLRDFPKGL